MPTGVMGIITMYEREIPLSSKHFFWMAHGLGKQPIQFPFWKTPMVHMSINSMAMLIGSGLDSMLGKHQSYQPIYHSILLATTTQESQEEPDHPFFGLDG